jgi:transcriptional regulator of heat shock response
LLEKIKKYKASKYIYAKNLNSYGLSSSDKMIIKRFQTLDSHLKESDMSLEDKLKAYEITTLKNSIKARLEENLQEFRDELINQSKEFAKRRYNFIKNSREELINNPELDSNKALRTRFTKAVTFLTRFKTIESFIDECVKDAEKDFDNNINLIVERIFDKELDVTNISCSSPIIDKNRINLIITDGKKRLYCRAIIAAEFSTVMVPHVRFIVTEKK